MQQNEIIAASLSFCKKLRKLKLPRNVWSDCREHLHRSDAEIYNLNQVSSGLRRGHFDNRDAVCRLNRIDNRTRRVN